MSAQSIQDANTKFNSWKTSLSSYQVTNVTVQPGYGIVWYQTPIANPGTPEKRSAWISEIAQNDSDYIATFNSLLSSQGPEASKSNMLYIVGGLLVGFILIRWIYRKLFKRRRR